MDLFTCRLFGFGRFGRPSFGAWVSYGLGSVNENLPAFVVITSTWTGRKEAQSLYNRLWGSGFLASKHQGVALRSKGDPVLFLSNPPGVNEKTRRRMLDSLARLNQKTLDAQLRRLTSGPVSRGCVTTS